MLNFMGIGAQKCGTTWLYQTLATHPRIAFPGGKEVHYWNRPGDRSVAQYAQLFSDDSRCNGDFTPAYGYLPIDTIRRIHEAYPDLRLFYLIRNPMERAWSAARMALERAELEHDEVSDRWFVEHFQSRGSLARGDFEACIRRWRSVFPTDQLLVLRYDALAQDPVTLANRCLNHLGLDSSFSEQDRARLSIRVFEGDGVALRPSLLPVLKELYAQKIASLAACLGEDLGAWSTVHPA